MAILTLAAALPNKNPLPDDVPAILRRLANQVEAGEVTQLLVAACVNDEYDIYLPSSRRDNVVLAALVTRKTTDQLFEGE